MIALQEGVQYSTKFVAKGYKYPVKITKKSNRLWFSFGFNRTIMDEVKSMQGAKYHGYDVPNPVKQWSVIDCSRNHFQIEYLEGKNPYEIYDAPLIEAETRRPTYKNQGDNFRHMITRQYCNVAAEMGTGKTLAAIEAMEWLAMNKGIKSWFFVAPKSALISVQLEFDKWKALVRPQFFTYDELKRIVDNWPSGSNPPQGLIGDESSRCKNSMSQRSEAMQYLADNIRSCWGRQGAVILMSGTPAPKSPVDWWSQLEITCPGFIKEGTPEKFRKRLAIMQEGKSEAGGTFQKVAAWRDNENLCDTCGKLKTHSDHDEINMIESWYHPFKPSKNEIDGLYRRMKGLVVFQFKKDCYDLPEKQYILEYCKPSSEIINASKLIVARGESAIKTMILLRELSDGFQYDAKECGMQVCPACDGTRTRVDFAYIGPDEKYDEYMQMQLNGQDLPPDLFKQIEAACPNCSGTGEIIKYARDVIKVPCPKEDKLLEILDQHEDVGRIVISAGFTGSIERCIEACLKKHWYVIRLDGQGWWTNLPGITDAKDMVKAFQRMSGDFDRIAFVMQPGSGGMGLTLTASPTMLYYSNDFNGESRMQSEDRCHRLGMDMNRGLKIIDLIHLPTDLQVLNNLKNKRRLQDLTMGEIRASLYETEEARSM